MAAAATTSWSSHTDWRPQHSPWLIGISVLLATFMEVLDTSIANVALPHIAGNLSSTPEEATWVLTSYLISNAVILSATGWLSRFFGRKAYLGFSVLIFTASSALCGMAHSLNFLIIARILQGLGGGGLQPLAQAVLLESFPHEDRGTAMAAYGMGIVLAPIIGPTLGGWITDNYSWRWIFFINIPIGLVGYFMQQMFVEDPPYLKGVKAIHIDYTGFGLMALSVGLLQLILDRGQQVDWFEAAWVQWTAVAVVLLFVAFIFWELTHKDPIVNLRILKNRNFAVASSLMALLGAVLYGSTVLLPIFLQVLLKYPALHSGLAIAPRGIGSFIGMIIIGRIIKKFDERLLVLFGFVGISLSSWLLSRLSLEVSVHNIAWPLVLNGFTMAFIFVPMTTLSVATLKQDEIYQSTGIYALMRNIGGSVGISLLITLQSRLSQVHQAALVSHLSPYNYSFNQTTAALGRALTSRGIPDSQTSMGSLGILYNSLLQQASLLSFMDCFRWMSIACIIFTPMILLFRKARHHRPPLIVE